MSVREVNFMTALRPYTVRNSAVIGLSEIPYSGMVTLEKTA